LDWLLLRPEGFSLFTDHNNLVYVFNPYGLNASIATHTAAKLIRWALKLSSYSYTIEHVTGLDNLWSDLLTRWAAPTFRARMSALTVVPTASSSDEEFVWPDAAELQRVQ
jgi:RNase H-like domain found in reverse transcriptase